MGYIYMLTSPSGKSYIGQTIRPIEKRLEEHQRKGRNCSAIYNAIQKHGWGNFEKDWYECPDDNLNLDEDLIVREMGTLSPEGYNLREGGGSTGKMSESTRHKISEAKKGKKSHNIGIPMHKETKQKISEAKKGERSHMWGVNNS